MCSFSCTYSLPVMWQRWQTHHSICCIRKPHGARKLHGSVLQNWNYGWAKLAGIGIFDLFCSCDLDLESLTQWPSYTNLTRIPGDIPECMNCLHQGIQKLSSDKQADRQTDTTKIIYHAALRVVNNAFTCHQALWYWQLCKFYHSVIANCTNCSWNFNQ